MKRVLFQRIILSLTTLLLLSACGVKTVYNNLDWVLEGMVEDYVSLTETQELDVEKHVAFIMKWHRETQLTVYIEDLKKIKGYTHKGLDDASTELIFDTLLKRWEGLKGQFAPAMADVLLTLSPQQIEELFIRLNEQNKETDEEYKETSDEEKNVKSGETLISNFEDWLGPLNAEQEQMLKSWPQRFKSAHEDRTVFRKKWQAALKQVIESDLEKEIKREQLQALILKPDKYQTDEHKQKLIYNSKQIKEMVLTLDQTITEEQRAHLGEEIDYYIVNFEELAAVVKK